MARLINADALVPDFLVPTSSNNTPCKRYVSMEQIHNAPTIEPEQKTGRWIYWEETIETACGTFIVPQCKCSECDTVHDIHAVSHMKYCYVCGAKMDKRQKHLGNESDLIVLDEVTFNFKRGDEDEVN